MNYIKSLAKEILPDEYRPYIRDMLDFGKALPYIGNQFICPCCGGHFRKFLESTSSKHEYCPRCQSARRHRLLWLYLKNKTNLFEGQLKLLHIAPEYCLFQNFRRMKNLDYISADLNSSLAMVKMDLTNIEYNENVFDVIICSHVLEHIPDDRKAIKELWRVLKTGGWAILQVPIDPERDRTFEDPSVESPEERERLFGRKGHVRRYGHDYKDRLAQYGFTVKVDGYVRELGSDKIQKYSLKETEEIYFCRKN